MKHPFADPTGKISIFLDMRLDIGTKIMHPVFPLSWKHYSWPWVMSLLELSLMFSMSFRAWASRPDLSQYRFTDSHRLYLTVTRALSYEIKWAARLDAAHYVSSKRAAHLILIRARMTIRYSRSESVNQYCDRSELKRPASKTHSHCCL